MCADCEARRKMAREALLSAKLGEALVHVAKGAAEIVGIKEKTGAKEYAEKAGDGEAIQIDAGDPPMPPVKSRKR